MSPDRILVITRNFPPLQGGMERLNFHLVEELSRFADVWLVAPEGAAGFCSFPAKISHVPLKPLSSFLLRAALKSLRLAGDFKPDLVIAGSGLTAPIALLAARRVGAYACAYVHGLDLIVPHPIYKAFWRPALRRMDSLIANSRATLNLARQVGVSPGRIAVVPPGVCVPIPDPQARKRFRIKHGFGDAPLLLSVGRLAARKGLREFVTDVLPDIVAELPSVIVAIIGAAPRNALFAEAQTPESIRSAADASGVGERLRFLGTVGDADLEDAYAAADAHVFPVRYVPQDPEGFGMVAIEAAASGLQTVAYATGGVVEAVADGLSGRLVQSGDSSGFARAVLELLRSPLPRSCVTSFAEQFSWSHFGQRVREAVQLADAG